MRARVGLRAGCRLGCNSFVLGPIAILYTGGVMETSLKSRRRRSRCVWRELRCPLSGAVMRCRRCPSGGTEWSMGRYGSGWSSLGVRAFIAERESEGFTVVTP